MDDGIVTWGEVARQLPRPIVDEILRTMTPRHVRTKEALIDWWTKPRGYAAIQAAIAHNFARDIRTMMGDNNADDPF